MLPRKYWKVFFLVVCVCVYVNGIYSMASFSMMITPYNENDDSDGDDDEMHLSFFCLIIIFHLWERTERTERTEWVKNSNHHDYMNITSGK